MELFEVYSKGKDITVFDVDDTLVVTKSKIKVFNPKTGYEIELTPQEFNTFKTKAYDKFDFSDFRDLENLVRNTKLLICCEGAISHVSHAFGIKTIALYQKNRPDITYFWTNHMKNIKLIPRSDIKHIKNKLKKISNN